MTATELPWLLCFANKFYNLIMVAPNKNVGDIWKFYFDRDKVIENWILYYSQWQKSKVDFTWKATILGRN